MSTLATPLSEASPRPATASMRSLQPQLSAVSAVFLAAIVPFAIAASLDDRLVNGVNIWIKPIKFLGSLAVYYATLAWLHVQLPTRTREGRLGRALVLVPVLIGVLEMTWLVLTAAVGEPSHFNRSAPIYNISYALAGVGATTLVLALLTMGISIARDRASRLSPAMKLSVVLGCAVSFLATMITAGYLSSGAGHWVGGVASDAAGLPLLGWSRSGGDLRVAHFFSMHALQAIPLMGFVIGRSGLRQPRTAVWLATGAYTAFIAWTFFQALAGRPFL